MIDLDGRGLFCAVVGHGKAAAREDKVKARSSVSAKGDGFLCVTVAGT